MITDFKKQSIKKALKTYVERYESQNKAANSLKGVSAGTVSQVLNNNWELIKAEMWRNIASQIDWAKEEWKVVETTDFKIFNHLLSDAQENSNVFAVTGEAGTGKSCITKLYVKNNKNAYLIQCNEFWNRKYFLAELLTAMGRDYSGLTVAEMMMEAISVLKKKDAPLIILDEADKLSDQVLYFFITLYNQLEDHCGIVLCATDHLSKRIRKGLKLNKKGYKEIYSRIGRKFIELRGVDYSDVVQICVSNGVEDKKAIREIFNDCDGDLRRVKRKIHAYKNAA